MSLIINKMNPAKRPGIYWVLSLITLIILSAVMPASAQTNTVKHEVSTAVPLLRMNPDTRAAGLGEASLATDPDASSGMGNPAKAVFARDVIGISLNYAPWLRDITSDSYLLSLAGYKKLDEKQAIITSLRYFSSGRVEERDYNNSLVQLITPTEFALDAGYSMLLSPKFSLGITFRYIHSSIGKTVNNVSGASNSFAADLSGYFNNQDEEGKGLTAGFTVANLGTGKISYGLDGQNDGFLPAKAGLGLSYSLPLQNEDKIIITGEINKSLVPLIPEGEDGYKEFNNYSVFESYGKGLNNRAFNFSTGAEYSYQDLLAIRAGYFAESEEFGNRKYFTVGAGLSYQNAGLNLAYIIPSGNGINRNALSNTLRLGLTFNFNGK